MEQSVEKLVFLLICIEEGLSSSIAKSKRKIGGFGGSMPKVVELITRLFPWGTNPPRKASGIELFPRWPPDLFAAVSSIVERSGCYSHPRYIGGSWTNQMFDKSYIETVRNIAEAWKVAASFGTYSNTSLSEIEVNRLIQRLEFHWSELLGVHNEIECYDSGDPHAPWWDHAMLLLAIADEASAGIGFFPGDDSSGDQINPFVHYWTMHYGIWDWLSNRNLSTGTGTGKDDEVYKILEDLIKNTELSSSLQAQSISMTNRNVLERFLQEKRGLPFSPSSLCIMVPNIELCVQPKTRASNVGCTLRSLSHHLALLPSVSQVESFWRVASPFARADTPKSIEPQALNILLVPFPYTIPGNSFFAAADCVASVQNDSNAKSRFFDVEQKWLKIEGNNPVEITPRQMADFIVDLIKKSNLEVDQVHGLILPELALTTRTKFMERLSEILKIETSLELFISGVLLESENGRGPRNGIIGSVLRTKDDLSGEAGDARTGVIVAGWEQAKHHRWKVEKHQIRRYNLGGRLDPHIDWWEHIDISGRQCNFVVFRHEACLTAIVCEDLARIDPVQTAIRSIGPNLLIALLMDGPQVEYRWSGRYATVLADDPGCAVLALTSMGLLKRAAMPEIISKCQIALWKEAGGDRAVELSIPADHHALLLTLSYKTEDAFTIDGRQDSNRTVALSLSGTHPIKHSSPPVWLDGLDGLIPARAGADKDSTKSAPKNLSNRRQNNSKKGGKR